MTQEMEIAIVMLGSIASWALIIFVGVKLSDHALEVRSRRMDARIKLMYAEYVAEVKRIFGEMDRVLEPCKVTLSDISDDELAQMFLKTFNATSNDAFMKMLVRAWVNNKGYLK